MKLVLVITALVFIFSCAPKPIKVDLLNSFDKNEASLINKTGTGKIIGNAFVRKMNGDIVTCAGNEALLIPQTKYATERMEKIYKNTDGGFSSVRGPSIEFNNNSSDYSVFVRKANCDSTGNFVFENVADGNYYIVTQVLWHIPFGYETRLEGGTLMKKVNVTKGSVEKVILSY